MSKYYALGFLVVFAIINLGGAAWSLNHNDPSLQIIGTANLMAALFCGAILGKVLAYWRDL